MYKQNFQHQDIQKKCQDIHIQYQFRQISELMFYILLNRQIYPYRHSLSFHNRKMNRKHISMVKLDFQELILRIKFFSKLGFLLVYLVSYQNYDSDRIDYHTVPKLLHDKRLFQQMYVLHKLSNIDYRQVTNFFPKLLLESYYRNVPLVSHHPNQCQNQTLDKLYLLFYFRLHR